MPFDTRETAHGAPAYALLRQTVAAVKRDDPLAPVSLVVPTELVGVTARRALARDAGTGRPGIAGLTVLTLRRLAEQLVGDRLARAGRRPLTDPVLAAAVRRVLAEQPGLFAPVAEHIGTVEALAAAYRQLRPLEPPVVDDLAVPGGPLVGDVVRIHRLLRHLLDDGWFDPVDLLHAATETADRTVLRRFGTLIVFLPRDLDGPEQGLLEAVSVRAPTVVIKGMATEAYGSRVLHATDPDDEVRAVVREVVTALEHSPGNRIAVFYGTADPYARLLHEHFAAAGVTVHGRAVRPTIERLLPRTLLRLLALPDHQYRRDELMAALADAPVWFRGGRVRSAQWERISRDAGIIRGRDWDRLAALAAEQRDEAVLEAAEPEPREWRIERAERTAEQAETLLAFVNDLRTRLAVIDSATTWADAAAKLTALWNDLLGRSNGDVPQVHLPEEDRRAAEKVAGVLAGLPSLDGISRDVSRTTAREVLELELADELDRVGSTGVGVHVGPVSDGTGTDVDLVAVVGLAEGLLPAQLRDDPLLPDVVRERTSGALPTMAERLARQHSQLLAALAGAPERLLSFPRGDLRRGGERVPSRWLVPTLRRLTGDEQLRSTTWSLGRSEQVVEIPSYSHASETAAFPATAREWRLRRVVGASRRGEPIVDALAEPFVRRTIELRRARRDAVFSRFDGNLTGVTGLPDPTARGSVSPTALESWTACPHGYFLSHVLRIRPVEAPEEVLRITPLERGSLVHAIYERFVQEALDAGAVPDPDSGWDEDSAVRLRAIAEEELGAAEGRGVTGAVRLWEQDRADILADVAAFLDRDNERRARGRLTPIATELPFDAVEVELPDDLVVRLRGKADRIDRAANGQLVVADYKTGGAGPYAGLGPADPVKHGHRLQLPVYALAARDRLGEPTTPVRAEYWFATRKGGFASVGYDVDDAVLTELRAALAVIVDGIRSGLFPPRPKADSGAYHCVYCDADGLGDQATTRTWERVRTARELASYIALIHPAGGGDG